MEFLSLPFIQRAILVGITIGSVCALLSIFVVLRKMAFIGHGISHAAFGGVAFALLLGISPFVGAIIFCFGASFLITWLSQKKRISEDSAIGVALTLTMALGSIFIALKKGYTSDIFGYLFGDILLILPNEVIWVLLTCFIIGIFLIIYFRKIYSFSFNEELAWVDGIPVRFLHFLLIILLTLIIIVSIKLIGAILISSFLLLPGLSAIQIFSRIRYIIITSLSVSILSILSGIVISYYFELPCGAVIVCIQFIILCLFLILKFYYRKEAK